MDENVAVLVAPEDVQALAVALRALANSRELRDRLRGAALDRASRMWSAEDMVAAYDELYRFTLRRG